MSSRFSPSQTEKLTKFMAVTNTKTTVAEAFLQDSGWNSDAAIALFLVYNGDVSKLKQSPSNNPFPNHPFFALSRPFPWASQNCPTRPPQQPQPMQPMQPIHTNNNNVPINNNTNVPNNNDNNNNNNISQLDADKLLAMQLQRHFDQADAGVDDIFKSPNFINIFSPRERSNKKRGRQHLNDDNCNEPPSKKRKFDSDSEAFDKYRKYVIKFKLQNPTKAKDLDFASDLEEKTMIKEFQLIQTMVEDGDVTPSQMAQLLQSKARSLIAKYQLLGTGNSNSNNHY